MKTCTVDRCDKPHNARGYCWGHYERWKKLGHPDANRPLNTRVRPDATMRERLMRRIPKGLSEDECWPWQGSLGGKKRQTGVGYGKFTVKGKQYDAHRVSWELYHGRSIPAGYQVLHSCDNPLCINPRHLDIGTNNDNIADMEARGRAAGRCPLTGRFTPRGD